MTKVVNLKITVKNMYDELKKNKGNVGKNLDRMRKELNQDILDLFPETPYNIVSFELHNSYVSFANAIERVLISEFPVWSLVRDNDLYETTGDHVRFDELDIKINSIPIHQTELNKLFYSNKDPKKLYKFSLNVENKNILTKNVNTSDIIVKGKNNEVVPLNKFIQHNINIQILYPGDKLSMKFRLERGYGYDKNGGSKFPIVPIIHNKILDHIPLETRHKQNSLGISSLEHDPKKFYILYNTYTYYENPLDIMLICIDEIIRRVTKVGDYIRGYIKLPKTQDNLKNLKENVMFKDENIEIRKEYHTYIIILYNESTTISKLYSQCICNSLSISYVGDSVIHPSMNEVFIKIQDDNAIKIMLKTEEKIIKELKSVRKSFEKNNKTI